MSKQWVIGFTEAEGIFYITRNGKDRNGNIQCRHELVYTQARDIVVLEALAIIFFNMQHLAHQKIYDESRMSKCIYWVSGH